MATFQKARRSQVFLKLAITGPSGSGKTYSALRLATGLANRIGKRIAVIDTENRSASLYAPADDTPANPSEGTFDFDCLEVEPPYDHAKFINGIRAAVEGGYGVAIIDSSSHFWEGILEYKSKLDSRPGSNSYTNWNEAGSKFKDILEAVLQSPIHLICCLRSKMDYVLEAGANGKQVPKKVGMAPIMRDGIEYEFSTVFDVALNHECATSKDRTGLFKDSIFQITEKTGERFHDWFQTAHRSEAPESAEASALPESENKSLAQPPVATDQPEVTKPKKEKAPPKPNGTEKVFSGMLVNKVEPKTKGVHSWFEITFAQGNNATLANTFSSSVATACEKYGEDATSLKVTLQPSSKGGWQIFAVEPTDALP